MNASEKEGSPELLALMLSSAARAPAVCNANEPVRHLAQGRRRQSAAA